MAILLVLNYTPLGYLQIGPLSASLLTVPVAIGMTMRPRRVPSWAACSARPALSRRSRARAPWARPCFKVSPFGTFVVCFVARVLVGLCAGLIFAALRKAMPKNEKLCCFLGGLAAGAETVFFMGFCADFYNCEYVQNLANAGRSHAFMFIVLLVGVQAILSGPSAASWPVRFPCRCGNI